jgi:hypothetical protein
VLVRVSAAVVAIIASTFTLLERVPILVTQLGSRGIAVASPLPSTTSSTAAPVTSTTVAPTTARAKVAFTPPPTAPATTGATWEEQVGNQALQLIHYPIASTGFTVHFLPARAGYYGLTEPGTRRINIYVRPGEGVAYTARILAHEVGHAVDIAFNSDARRAEWRRLRGIASTAWFSCSGCTDFSTPAGDFAEAFAYWQVHSADYRSVLAAPPSAAQVAQLMPLFNR